MTSSNNPFIAKYRSLNNVHYVLLSLGLQFASKHYWMAYCIFTLDHHVFYVEDLSLYKAEVNK